MNKLDLQTPDLTEQNIEKLMDLFPNCVTEVMDENGEIKRSIDFDLLRQELSKNIIEGPKERYQLTWPGKRKALLTANVPINKTLRPCREESVDFDSTENLFIEGDNLDALKLLQETYLGKVDMIYIDPPYNTGRNLLYKNDFSEKRNEFLVRSNQVGDLGGKLVSNLETSGRFHSDWLSMMYQRLRVARNLLASDGVLVCAIDENEFGTLSVLMKEIFIAPAWEHAYVTVVHNPRGQQGKNFSYVNEYLIFVYPSGIKAVGNRKIEPEDVKWSQFRNWGGESERKDAKNCFYPLLVKDSKIIGFGEVCDDDFHPKQTEEINGISYVYPIDNMGIERKWRYARQSVNDIANMLRARKDNGGYQIEIGKTFGLYRSVWNEKRYDSNEYGTKLVNSLIENSGFTFPKSLWAVYDPIEAITGNKKNAIILDFFAGSSTTAHAVLQLNDKDDGKRKFVMVQLPEKIDEKSEIFKSGYETISDISKERIRRAGKKIKEESGKDDLDIGFRVLKVDSSNMEDVYYNPDQLTQEQLPMFQENIKPDRSEEDLLFQVMLDLGIELSAKIEREEIDGKTVYFVNRSDLAQTDLIACFDKKGSLNDDFLKKLAELKALKVVFRDAGFKNDSAKINAEQIFKLISPSTGLNVI